MSLSSSAQGVGKPPDPAASPSSPSGSSPAAARKPMPRRAATAAATQRAAARTPAWVPFAIAALVALLIALLGTAYMVASSEDRQAAWQHKAQLLSTSYWADIFWDGLDAMRFALAGADRVWDGADTPVAGRGEPSLAAPAGKPLVQPPPPALLEKEARPHVNGRPSDTAGGLPETSSARPPPHSDAAPRCFTLEQYSDRFVATDRQRRDGKHFYRCGTRLVDLRIAGATSPAAVACSASLSPPSSSSDGPATSHPHLRVVLTAAEVEWHVKQKLNLGVELFPLSRLNDDYCDCLDGTDEVSTGACSMSGPGMPLGMERWRAYAAANKNTLLYEDQLEGIATPLRMRSPVADVHVLGGPLLPFPCTADPETWLSPTMLGDGIVDCCDGSDESREVWASRSGPARLRDEQPSASSLEVLRQQVLHDWASRRDAVSFTEASYVDKIHPYFTSAAALLVDKGFTSLFTCPVVHAQRLATAEMLLDITRKGHATRLQREVDGWEQLGRFLLENQTRLSSRLGNTTRELERLRFSFADTMEKKQVRDPIAAGIPISELERFEALTREQAMLQQEAAYLSLIVTQGVFGEHYEYHPLFGNMLRVPAKEVVTSFGSDAATVRRQRARRRMSVTECMRRQYDIAQYDQYAEAALAQGMTIPPRPLPLHVDNISLSALGLIPARFALAAQRMTSLSDREMIARGKGVLLQDEPFDKDALGAKFDDFALSPTYPLGHWQPYRVDRNASVMAVLDPAGDVDLPRRFSIAPTTHLTRGGGRLQTMARKRERDRTFTVKDDDDANGNSKARSRPSGAEEDEQSKKKDIEVPLLYHRNTPNILATHNFDGGSLRCGFGSEPLEAGREMSLGESDTFTSLRVAYGCAEEDGILGWARNGRCRHEVVVGTPSACTRWVLKELEQRVERHQRAVAEHTT